METPLQIFCYFFNENIINQIVEETLRAAIADNIQSQFKLNIDDIYRYIGILIYMSLYRFPTLKSYWGKHAFGPIRACMTRSKFESIKRYLCLRDENKRVKKGEAGYDPLYRTRTLIDHLNDRFDSIPKQARLCVDEQMCGTKMKHHLRQYMPNKPHKWGIKLFVLCDSYGYAYRFEIYSGAGDNVILPGEPDLGASANIVVRLTNTVQKFQHHIIYFDNFYTSVPLMVYLRAKGIYSLGTVRPNRIPNSKLPCDNIIKDKPRGFSTEFVGSSYGVTISKVLWKDNRAVRLLSTYVGVQPFERGIKSGVAKTPRYDRKSKKYVEIDCPQIIREYNAHMGGVDLMDGLIGRYHIKAKTRDSATRIFYHLVDMAVTNAYILYRRISNNEKRNPKNDCNLPDFREEIAAGLVEFQRKPLMGRPRSEASRSPSLHRLGQQSPSVSSSPPARLKIGAKSNHPIADLRLDLQDHFPIWLSRDGGKRWCKNCKTSQTQCICKKCNLHLCCTANKNCFFDYHNKK